MFKTLEILNELIIKIVVDNSASLKIIEIIEKHILFIKQSDEIKEKIEEMLKIIKVKKEQYKQKLKRL